MKLTLATRGSRLALWQAEATRAALSAAHPQAEIELLIVESRGDQDQTSELARFGSIGIFTVQVDRAVLAGEADIGVHSMKDMTTTLQDGVVLAGTLPRGPIEDVLVSRGGETLALLPEGSRVATGSLRRAAMLCRARPDVQVVGIRGNVETRLAKVERGEADALLLARAGLVRLGLEERITEVLDVARFLPAVGQGIVGLTCRADEDEVARHLGAVSDPFAWHAALAERALLRELHGGCNAPIGAHARIGERALSMTARVLSPGGGECVEGSIHGLAENAEMLGEQLAAELFEKGAERLVEIARS